MKHRVQVPMRWSDMDAYQHINNVAFLGYFETARVDLFFDQPTHDEQTGLRRGIVVVEHTVAYKRSVLYDAAPLDVDIWVSGVRAAAFHCHYELYDHGTLAVTGSSLLATVDFALHRPRRLTPEEKAFLARHQEE